MREGYQTPKVASSLYVLPMHVDPSSVVNIEADFSELIGKTVSNLEDAYDLYNEYSFKYGFGIRKSRSRMRADKALGLRGKEFCCSKAGFKKCNGKDNKYTKTDTRTGCRAMVYLKYDEKNDVWTVTEHVMEHNHLFVPAHQRHLIKSHKRMNDKELEFLKVLRNSGFNVADGIELLKKETDGSPSCVINSNNACNRLALDKKKHLKGMDANRLLNIFTNQLKDEKEFFYSFQVDEETGTLVSVFWRDSRMKLDYKLFGDLVVFETICSMNNCDLVCAPFIGMNNHSQSVMFGCGFIFNKSIESLQWLFNRFLESMENVLPKTIMTDQSEPTVIAVKDVFCDVHHRFCTWHVEENSKENIASLRSKSGFVLMFERCLHQCESIAEFDHYWQRLLNEHNCSGNSWLRDLYSTRSQWSSAYSKDVFYGGNLSSQRSKSANNSFRNMMSSPTDMVDLYGKFCDLVVEWRSKEKLNDYKCMNSVPETSFQNVGLISHAMQVFTIDVFELFEAEFKNILTCQQVLLSFTNGEVTYKVWTAGCELYNHVVVFNSLNNEIKCTCNKFDSTGILCCHCLRIYNIQNVQRIPNQYIIKRWTKLAVDDSCDELSSGSVDRYSLQDSAWRFQMKRKIDNLINLSDSSEQTRAYIEEVYRKAKIYVEEHQRNKRKINALEKVKNMARGRAHKYANGSEENEPKTDVVKKELASELDEESQLMIVHSSEEVPSVVVESLTHEDASKAASTLC